MIKFVILAGGLATRLRPLSNTIPKSLIQIAGFPFIYWQLKNLKANGVSEVVICIGHLGNKIKEAVDKINVFGIKIEYSEDGELLLGTGGALKNALPLLGENFCVIYGDSYLPFDYQSAINTFFNSKKKALMTIYKNKNLWDRSNVQYDGFKIIEYNKLKTNLDMEFIDYGMGVISSCCFDEFVSGACFDLAHIYNILSVEDELAAYVVYNRFYEIGTIAGIEDFERYIKEVTK
jgi:NDP-sugar pyrophosphorylase family protein